MRPMMKLALLVASLVSVNAFLLHRPNDVVTTAAIRRLVLFSTTWTNDHSKALWNHPIISRMQQYTPPPQEDGIVTAMAILNQAKLELGVPTKPGGDNIIMSSSSRQISFNDHNNVNQKMKSRAEIWERSVFDAMERTELHMEESASATGKQSRELFQAAVQRWRQFRIPFREIMDMQQQLETWERTVFDEMERLEHLMETSASATGAYSWKLIQTMVKAIRSIENPLELETRRMKIVYTQRLANMIRDMANRLESHVVENETRALDENEQDHDKLKEVFITSVSRTRVRPAHDRSGVISTFVSRLFRNVSKRLWRRA